MMLVIIILLTLSFEGSFSNSVKSHKRALEKLNNNAYIGVVMAYPTELAALLNSGYFVPSSDLPFLDIAGRRFNVGQIKGVDVIYVMTGEQTINAAITVQILLDSFHVKGIVHYGIAGCANDSLSLGDVVVPTSFAFTSSWKWKGIESDEAHHINEMKFGDFDIPKKGHNLLGKIEFTPYQLYSPAKQTEQLFWLPVDPKWFDISTQLQDIELQRCVDEEDGTYCLPQTPKVVYGLRGSTADVYLKNAAYRDFLFTHFNVSTVDEESAAVVMTCLSNGVPCIVFRGVSDMAGGEAGKPTMTTESLQYLAALNALNVALHFIAHFASIHAY